LITHNVRDLAPAAKFGIRVVRDLPINHHRDGISASAQKARTGEIDLKSLLIARRRLEADLGSRRLLVAAVNDQHFRSARQLLVDHGTTEALRAPDALQLSVGLGLKRAGLVSVFVAADQKLCRVATMEGFMTLNPEHPMAL